MPHGNPLTLLIATAAGWLNRQQAETFEYLVEENRVLKEQLGDRRHRLTDDQRRRLAAKGHALGRAALANVATIVTPDTILRWHRRLIAAKWTTSGRRVGRPGLMKSGADPSAWPAITARGTTAGSRGSSRRSGTGSRDPRPPRP